MTKYTKDHEWITVDGDVATVGITDFAQKSLGDVVFVELPETGASYSEGDDAAVVESVKAASEIYAPIDGEITAVNEDLEADPSLVNTDPTGSGWFFKMSIADAGQLDGLMDEAAYNDYLKDLD